MKGATATQSGSAEKAMALTTGFSPVRTASTTTGKPESSTTKG
jgi:hypothetical protein